MKAIFSILASLSLILCMSCASESSTTVDKTNELETEVQTQARTQEEVQEAKPEPMQPQVDNASIAEQLENLPPVQKGEVAVKQPSKNDKSEVPKQTEPKAKPVAQTQSAPEPTAPTTSQTPVEEPKQKPQATKPEPSKAQTPIQEPTPVTTPEPEPKPAPEPAPKTFDHSGFDKLLRAYVSSSGKVNYSGFKKDEAALDAYLAGLAENVPSSGDSRTKQIAFWTNAYNAFTIKLIVQNYPVKSIRDIDGGNPWDTKWISLGNKKYSLNQIEKDILLKKIGEPRVHFAVNCAAKSCPPLHNRAFTSSNINSKLESLTRSFINNESFNSISTKRLELSKIFEWYASDFNDVKTFISKYTDVEITKKTKISYNNYDWSLNK